MSELKAQDYYNEMKEIVEVPDFTKLTSTGIDPDYESIFDFAEAYYDARIEANGATTGEKQCILPVVSESFLKSLVVENIVKSYGVDLMLVKELAAEIRKL